MRFGEWRSRYTSNTRNSPYFRIPPHSVPLFCLRIHPRFVSISHAPCSHIPPHSISDYILYLHGYPTSFSLQLLSLPASESKVSTLYCLQWVLATEIGCQYDNCLTLSGRRPFHGTSAEDLVHRICHEAPDMSAITAGTYVVYIR